MKIENIKINSFGKLNEKEIDFSDKINVVYGENESGKSTLLKFITNTFYGTSKNKNGKEFSDYDQYKPWIGEEFSGKIKYKLDDGKKYEVFREFGKKNPKIYNENLEDISKDFTIDKTYGNQFFSEQTGVDEKVFYSTLVSMQQEVKINRNDQNAILQKVANLTGTGDDSISYKKAIEKINKKQIEEIGTNRSQGRPINIIKEEKFKLQDEIGEIQESKQRKEEIEIEKEKLENELLEINEKLDILRKIKDLEEKNKLEQEKIKINEKLKLSQEEKKKGLEKEKEEILKNIKEINTNNKNEKKNNENTIKSISIILFIIGFIIEILNISIFKNLITLFIGLVIILISIIFLFLENKKQKENNKKNEKEYLKQLKLKNENNNELEKIDIEINVLQKSISEQERHIETSKKIIFESKNLEKEKIINQVSNRELVENLLKYDNIQTELNRTEEEYSSKKLEIHSLELEENIIKSKLEELASIEEQLDKITKREEELKVNNDAIEYVKEILEISYQKMKQNITPRLTNILSENIEKITNGKYNKVNLHDEKGIIIEKENGEYIEAEKLSKRNNRSIIFIFTFSIVKRDNR